MLGGSATATALALAMALAQTGATRPGPLQVVVAVNSERDRQLAARVEGQTTDLDVVVTAADVGPGLTGDGLASAARTAAASRGAEVAVWFLDEGEDWVVNVSLGERTFRRRVTESSGALSSSASIEAAALVVRTALRGIVAGEDVPDSPPPPPPPVHLIADLGWTAALDRAGSAGHHGVELRLGVGVGGWRFELSLEEHPAETISSADATVRLERQAAALGVAYGATLGERWRLGGALGAELLRFPRVTTAVAAGLSATAPQSSWSLALRPEVELRVRLVWSMWAVLRLGADVLSTRAEFGVRTADGAVRNLASLWWVQPRASLGLALDFDVHE